jgi:hypothetical protein
VVLGAIERADAGADVSIAAYLIYLWRRRSNDADARHPTVLYDGVRKDRTLIHEGMGTLGSMRQSVEVEGAEHGIQKYGAHKVPRRHCRDAFSGGREHVRWRETAGGNRTGNHGCRRKVSLAGIRGPRLTARMGMRTGTWAPPSSER